MSFGAFGSKFSTPAAPASQSTSKSSPNNDPELSNPPSDSISAVSWAPAGADCLAVASWDNSVRIYEVSPTGQAIGKAAYNHENSVLCLAWSKDGSKVFSGGVDKAGRCYDLATGQATQVAAHNEPIKAMRWVDAEGTAGLLATGSWDKTIKYWDMRQSTPVLSVDVPSRVYSMDVRYPLMVAACADRYIDYFDLRNPSVAQKKTVSMLKQQTRVVSCFTEGVGYAVGSIEGRVGIQYIEKVGAQSDFSFKCHRNEPPLEQGKPGPGISYTFPVNDIAFHPVHGTFATVGSDGLLTFWDHTNRRRLSGYDSKGGPITCCAYNRTGTILAYGVSYDWSKGHGGNANMPVKVCLHQCVDDDTKKRTTVKK